VSEEVPPEGYKAEESLCVFQLHFSDGPHPHHPPPAAATATTGLPSAPGAMTTTTPATAAAAATSERVDAVVGRLAEYLERPTLLRHKPLTAPLLKVRRALSTPL